MIEDAGNRTSLPVVDEHHPHDEGIQWHCEIQVASIHTDMKSRLHTGGFLMIVRCTLSLFYSCCRRQRERGSINRDAINSQITCNRSP